MDTGESRGPGEQEPEEQEPEEQEPGERGRSTPADHGRRELPADPGRPEPPADRGRRELPVDRRRPGVPEQARRSGAPDLRVGDADRNAAMQALDRHMADGRLSVDEYGDRSAAASVAVTRSELAGLFADLPAPHPPLPSVPGAVPPSDAPASKHPGRWSGPHPASMLAIGLVAMVVLAVLPAVLITGGAFPGGGFFFLPLLFLMIRGFGRRRGGPY